MKKILIIGALALFSSCQESKVAYVDYAEVMNQYDAKKQLEGQFQERAQRFARKRDSISQAFQYEAQLFQQKAQSMSENKAQEEYTSLQSRGSLIGQQLQMEEQNIQSEGQVEMDSLLKKVRTRIQEYGKEKGYTYILAGGEGGTVLYGADSQNITDAIVEILNSSK